ncbi:MULTISPECIES: MetQ/NlpA family ABC transporter substrate-binding protein [unclassified Oceanobacillus]|uniref:MetQ/NlpA family ABC transporter substrate-binding protein n=1 Tax=unclassified Oceanobacillus TaxID=2630292 RepID=UPI001BEC9609|nr:MULTISPECIES: MetQ/NlpA family ABC transporter substrate-binding protein [unclassified Oceanobacillus]MBT2600064.1 MetQ/NlpA family ABC transporter substrate-binding protein [Oceanobacillus sp. ISL-74]MBT2652488.1 MetQ/NlpA family ABC transporter substrate-binding protein [Oceanobacillus sp. ISL-73]
MKKGLLIAIVFLAISLLAACGSEESSGSGQGLYDDEKLVIGVTAGPHEEILEKVTELAEEEGIEIESKVFTDYVMPNVALAEGEIDLNIFQTEPYFNAFKEDRNLDLVKSFDTVTFPMGIYSLDVDDVSELPEGSTIGLPSDPTNSGRALLLFEQAGLIELDSETGINSTVRDIDKNNGNYEFVELDSTQIARQLEELDAAAINTNFAIEAGFTPTEDSIYIEPKDSPYINHAAVRAENEDDEIIQKLADIYRSEEVKTFIEEEFGGSLIPSW